MSPVLKFATVFVLGIVGMTLAPRHACRLSSPILLVLVILACLVVLPFFASRTTKQWVVWAMSAAAPFVGFAAFFLYVEVLHWEHFPAWLLRDGTPNQVGAANGSQPIRSETNRMSPAAGSRR